MIEALYIHIPFCTKRCSYCDFYTNACRDDARMDAYVEALCLQLRRASKAGLLGDVKTIYIGGGTPTYLGMRRLNTLIYTISLSVNLENVTEFTVEANPESLDERMVKDLFALGVDRVSMGAQSFDDNVLKSYGRAHDMLAIVQAVSAVRTRIDNFSLDLVCGGPGQDMLSWAESVTHAIELGATHVSVYPLTLEEGTPLCNAVDAGEVTVASESEQADMMLEAERLLTEAGMQRYEVASYAYPGYEAKHNTAYWTGIEYLGLGAGAASMLCGKNFQRACDARVFTCEAEGTRHRDGSQWQIGDLPEEPSPWRVRAYADADDIAFSESLGIPNVEIEILSSFEARVEDLMLGMRLSRGVGVEDVEAVDGAPLLFDRFVAKGLVAKNEGRFVPTRRGWLMGNNIYGDIWSLTEGKRLS